MSTARVADSESRQIFISHSREDVGWVEPVSSAIGRADVKPFEAAYEDVDPPEYSVIQEEIERSDALFVVIGENAVSKRHILTWLGWEIGVAKSAGLPVWVIENVNEMYNLPAPGATDHVIWDSTEMKHRRRLKEIVEQRITNGVDETQTGRVETESKETRELGDPGSFKIQQLPWRTKCAACGLEYRAYFEDVDEFSCPSCRITLTYDYGDS